MRRVRKKEEMGSEGDKKRKGREGIGRGMEGIEKWVGKGGGKEG
jgi:hypothetical protein